MEKNTSQRLHGLDHLRALAITMVFLFHYMILSGGQPEWLPDVARFGWSGVDLFFVLSGFLISSQLFAQMKTGQSISFKRFFTRRFFRIVPAYLVVLTLYFCIPFFREKESLPPLWKFLTFTQNIGLNFKLFGTFSHAWSLCVEEHFYIFLPLILIVLQTKKIKRGWWLLVALFLFGFFIRHYSYSELYFPETVNQGSWVYWYQYVYYPTWNRLDGLLIGVAIAAVFTFLPEVWARVAHYGNILLLSGLAVLTGAWFLCYEQQTYVATVYGFPVVAIGYGLLVAGAVSESSVLYRWKSRGTALIATLSYSVYLIHKATIHMTRELLDPFEVDANVVMLISAATTLLGAWVLYKIVERPFLRLRERYGRKKERD